MQDFNRIEKKVDDLLEKYSADDLAEMMIANKKKRKLLQELDNTYEKIVLLSSLHDTGHQSNFGLYKFVLEEDSVIGLDFNEITNYNTQIEFIIDEDIISESNLPDEKDTEFSIAA